MTNPAILKKQSQARKMCFIDRTDHDLDAYKLTKTKKSHSKVCYYSFVGYQKKSIDFELT